MPLAKRVEMSLDPAGRSACATSALADNVKLFSRGSLLLVEYREDWQACSLPHTTYFFLPVTTVHGAVFNPSTLTTSVSIVSMKGNFVNAVGTPSH